MLYSEKINGVFIKMETQISRIDVIKLAVIPKITRTVTPMLLTVKIPIELQTYMTLQLKTQEMYIFQ